MASPHPSDDEMGRNGESPVENNVVVQTNFGKNSEHI
jgi:hypothetical protein